jgi:hypothetical protein
MSESTNKADGNFTSKNKPEIQLYSVSKGKYSSRLNKSECSPSELTQGNSRTSNSRQQNKNANYNQASYDTGNYSSYYDDESYYESYPTRRQRKNPAVKSSVQSGKMNSVKAKESFPNAKYPSGSEAESVNTIVHLMLIQYHVNQFF